MGKVIDQVFDIYITEETNCSATMPPTPKGESKLSPLGLGGGRPACGRAPRRAHYYFSDRYPINI